MEKYIITLMKECIEKEITSPLNADYFSGYYPCDCVKRYCDYNYTNGISNTCSSIKLSDRKVCDYFLGVMEPYHLKINGILVCNR
jgi:hypothetical protein